MSNEQTAPLPGGLLTPEERDTTHELTSIAMGAAASTLGLLLGKEVTVSTPSLLEYATLADMDIPFGDEAKTLVLLQYVKGIYATSLFILKNSDARRLSEMMLGTAEASDGDALTEMQSGATGELMNQMMNAAATSLATVIHEAVEISNPEVMPYSSDMLAQCMPQILSEAFVANHIHLGSGAGEAPIELIELRVTSELRNQIERMMAATADAAAEEDEDEDSGAIGRMQADNAATMQASAGGGSQSAPPRAGGTATATGPARPASTGAVHHVDPVTVRPVEYASFDQQPHVFGEENKNLELVLDVTLNMTVELGKTDLSIKEVLELTRGSVIELDRIAGEPVDLMANGKLIAKGEVVVIEDNFGLRITSIVSPADRLRGL